MTQNNSHIYFVVVIFKTFSVVLRNEKRKQELRILSQRTEKRIKNHIFTRKHSLTERYRIYSTCVKENFVQLPTVLEIVLLPESSFALVISLSSVFFLVSSLINFKEYSEESLLSCNSFDGHLN